MNGWAVPEATLCEIHRLLSRNPELRREATAKELEERLGGQSSQSTGGVAVIPLRGLITPRATLLSLIYGGGYGLQGFRAALRAALDDDEISAILIDVDSPGGSTALIAETAAEIRAARGGKPIVAIANTFAASAAYHLASQADEVVATPSGEVGSIGVYCLHEDWSGFNEQLGVKPTYVYAGKYKVELNPDEPLADEARQALQEFVDEFYAGFVADVAKGRGVSPAAVRGGFGEGRVVTAKRALEFGMADRVASYEETVTKLVGGRRRRALSGLAAEGERPELVAGGDPSAPDPEPEPKDTQELLVRMRDQLDSTHALLQKEE